MARRRTKAACNRDFFPLPALCLVEGDKSGASMRLALRVIAFTSLAAAVAFAQTNTPAQMDAPKDVQPGAQVRVTEEPVPQIVTVPSGTKVLLVLKNAVSSRNA